MPLKKSAKKHARNSLRKKVFNISKKQAIKKTVRQTNDLIASGNKDEAQKAFQKAQKALDKAVKKGTIKKNTAARKKSRLVKKIKNLK
ncbi:MAG: 30S ribosomal protein S20 [Candidatus Moranbacteria bacterium]|jgi:small subunit ribosomal protein S20|nr:30S ribosomal protein S20 [Candidatus Moranbacteria bacterium]